MSSCLITTKQLIVVLVVVVDSDDDDNDDYDDDDNQWWNEAFACDSMAIFPSFLKLVVLPSENSRQKKKNLSRHCERHTTGGNEWCKRSSFSVQPSGNTWPWRNIAGLCFPLVDGWDTIPSTEITAALKLKAFGRWRRQLGPAAGTPPINVSPACLTKCNRRFAKKKSSAVGIGVLFSRHVSTGKRSARLFSLSVN